jgi:putative PIN family toxin of toxin-antitoxin system
MRILYDTNVLVKILSRREAILLFKAQILEKQLVHITSSHILSEVEAVLFEKMNLTRQKSKVAARLLARQSTVVEPKNIEKICRDPFDDYVVAAAVAGNVEYIITEDKDLLVLKQHKSVKIVTYAHFEQ